MPEERRHVYSILQDIVSHAQTYLRGLETLFYPRHYQTFRIEEDLARSAFHLLQCFDEFKQSYGAESPPVIPLRVERSLKAIRGIVSHQIDRWGWSDLKRPDGKTFIAGHLQRHRDRKELPYLRAVLTWRLAENVEPHGKADDEADRARKLGIVSDPDLTPEQAKSLALDLHEGWCRDAALGDAPPHATQEEENELASHCDSVNAYFRGLVSPAELIAKNLNDKSLNETTTNPSIAEGPYDAERAEVLLDELDRTIGIIQASIEQRDATPRRDTSAAPSSAISKPRRRRGGRPPDTDAKEDRRIADAWKNGAGAFDSLDSLAREFNMTKRQVKLALDRYRKRVGKYRHRKSRQGD
jgi:hypothetical protein